MLNQTFNQDNLGDIGIAGAVSTSAPTYTTGTFAALSLNLSGLLRVDGSGVTQPISASTLPLPTGASTSALQTAGNTILSTISGQLPLVLGQGTMAQSLSVTIASNQSALSVTPTTAYAQGSATSGELASLIMGAVTAAAPTYTTATSNPLSLDTAGSLRTVIAEALPAGTNNIGSITNITGTVSLPTGAATAANQVTMEATLTTISGQLPPALGPQVAGSSLSIVQATGTTFSVTSDVSTTGTLTSVSLTTSSQVFLAANSARKGFIIYNDSSNMVFLAFAATASTTAFSTKIQAGGAFDSDIDYTGVVSGIASSASGAVRITEFT